MESVDLKPRILITGIGGFVAKQLASHYLHKGYQVFGIDRVSSPPNLNIESRVLDITDKGRVLAFFNEHDFEFVIHCAGIAHKGTSIQPRREIMKVNLEGTQNVFDGSNSCRSLKRVVFFSSIAVYDESQPHLNTNETAICNPVGDYGYGKWLAEQSGLKKYAENRFPLVILRFCPIYGPDRLIDLEKRIKAPGGFLFLIGSGTQRISFCSIFNVMEAVDLALQKENMVGQVFNVADAKLYSQKDLLDWYSQSINQSSVTIRIPVPLLRLLFDILSIIQPSCKRLYQSYFQKLAGEVFFDISRIMAAGYMGVEDLDKTIKRAT